jgi:hypothetical protein
MAPEWLPHPAPAGYAAAQQEGDRAMPLDETRAVARLPHLDVAITHRRMPEENAELLEISLRAVPNFDAAATLLDPFRLTDPARLLATWATFNPWLAWLKLAAPSTRRRLSGGSGQA